MGEAYDFPYDYEWEEGGKRKRIKKFLIGLLAFIKGFIFWNLVL